MNSEVTSSGFVYPIVEGIKDIDGVTYYLVRPKLIKGKQPEFVLRRYSDFSWLYHAMEDNFPRQKFPHFPRKTFGKATPDQVVQRVLDFEELLLFFLNNDQMKSSTPFRNFFVGKVLNYNNVYDKGKAVLFPSDDESI